MSPKVTLEIAELHDKTVNQLVQRYEEVFKEECRSRNKQYLIRRIAWRLQANAEGGLSERALKRAAELALDSEVRVTPPREHKRSRVVAAAVEAKPVRDLRLPPNGTMLHREYKGRPIRVLVLDDGFEYEGQLFNSLTAVANSITGSHVNGFQFFRLRSTQ